MTVSFQVLVHNRRRSRISQVLLFLLSIACQPLAVTVHAFVMDQVFAPPSRAAVVGRRAASRARTSSTTLQVVVDAARRKELLTRRGPHFYLDKSSGRIEFGATAYLKTQLEPDDVNNDEANKERNLEQICSWLRDERSLAMSIWDKNLIQERGRSIYRLEVMKLQFVTLQVKPWVDMEMKTLVEKATKNNPQQQQQQPVFCLRSVGFDPNIEILPGMRVTAESFGIIIEVAGQLRPSADGKGVQGAIAFQTTGTLSPPMRLLPESALKAACEAIVETVVKFATESFQKGAKEQYQESKKIDDATTTATVNNNECYDIMRKSDITIS